MITIGDLFDLEQWPYRELFQDLDYPWELLPDIEGYIRERMRPGNQGQMIGSAYVAADVEIGAGTIIEHGAMIKGPTIIGKNCVIRAGAYIRGRVLLGDNVLVGHATELKNAVILDGASLTHFNYVGDSVVGARVHLGAGSILSNLKTPISEIIVQTLERHYPTGLKKCGAFIGDDCEIGCNSVLNPGSIIGKQSVLYPLTSFRGVVGPGSIVKTKPQQETVIKQKR